MPSPFDTIVAPITGPGRAAIAVLRLSGPESWEVAANIFPSLPAEPQARHAYYGDFVHGDDGYLLLFREGHSFTGDDSAEMSIHGSPESVRRLLNACLEAGARQAEPGEFTQRAFLNGRIDLTQAEAIRETIEAQTSLQLKVAHRNRNGELKTHIQSIRSQILDVLSLIEAHVDFSEELGPLDQPELRQKATAIHDQLGDLVRDSGRARIIRNGIRIAIIGAPNLGKSSLFNAVVGSNRAIVTSTPGTTRDTIEATLEIGGQLVTLVDTAGIRETTDPIEQMGVARSEEEALSADLCWTLIDHSASTDSLPMTGGPFILVANKSDLGHHPDAMNVSALTGQGIPELLAASVESIENFLETPLFNERHLPLLSEAATAMQDAANALRADIPADLAVTELRLALAALGEITGDTATPDLLTEIFSRFCLGK